MLYSPCYGVTCVMVKYEVKGTELKSGPRLLLLKQLECHNELITFDNHKFMCIGIDCFVSAVVG